MYELYELVRIIEDNLDLKKTDWDLAIDQINDREKEILTKIRSKTRKEEYLLAQELGYQDEQDPNYRRYKRQTKNFLFEMILRYSPEKKPRPVSKKPTIALRNSLVFLTYLEVLVIPVWH